MFDNNSITYQVQQKKRSWKAL